MKQEMRTWLLESDISLQYLVHRDLLNTEDDVLDSIRKRIPNQGWAKAYLDEHQDHGHWGDDFYKPKWTSSHYTLLELKNIGCPLTHEIQSTIDLVLDKYIAKDGGIILSGNDKLSDVCVNGMFLNYACYYQTSENKLHTVVDNIISQQMKDGGFNCRLNRSGAVHSSLHSTICLLEGLQEYVENGYSYKLDKVKLMMRQSIEFILEHRLYKSDKTGEIIHTNMTKLVYPSRWKYDILRCLLFFAQSNIPYDVRMKDALELLMSKQSKEGKWPKQSNYSGKTYFLYERGGKNSRINTYRTLVVLKTYGKYL